MASAAPPQLATAPNSARSPQWLKYGILIAIEFAQRAPVSSPNGKLLFDGVFLFFSFFSGGIFHLSYGNSLGTTPTPPNRSRYTTKQKPLSTAIKKKPIGKGKKPLLTSLCLFWGGFFFSSLPVPTPNRPPRPRTQRKTNLHVSIPLFLSLPKCASFPDQTIQHIIAAPLALASPLNNNRSPLQSGPPRARPISRPWVSAHTQTGNLHGQNAFIPSAFAISAATHSTHTHSCE